MLGLFIVLYGFEGIYLHVSVWIAQKESQFRENCSSQRGAGGGWEGINFLTSKNPK